jgi:hypothetical protein
MNVIAKGQCYLKYIREEFHKTLRTMEWPHQQNRAVCGQLHDINSTSQVIDVQLHDINCISQVIDVQLHDIKCTSQVIDVQLHDINCTSQVIDVIKL